MGGETMTRIYCVKKIFFQLKRVAPYRKFHICSVVTEPKHTHRCTQSKETLDRQQAGTAISWTEKWTLGNRKRL